MTFFPPIHRSPGGDVTSRVNPPLNTPNSPNPSFGISKAVETATRRLKSRGHFAYQGKR